MALIEHPPSVVLLVQEGEQLVAVRQRRPGAHGDVLELPAGTCEPGETIVESADRELAEECGLSVSGWTELGSFWAAPAYSTERVTALFGTASGVQAAEPDDDEDITVERVPSDDAYEYLEDGVSLAALALWAAKLWAAKPA